MTEAKDYLDFLEQHRLMDDAQKYPLVAEYARSCEAEIARLRAALDLAQRANRHYASLVRGAALEGRE